MRAVVLLAVGPDGGAALARWVAERGIDGVRGIGLVGVTAPWAERPREVAPAYTIGADGKYYPQSSGTHTFGGRVRSDVDPKRLPLGPLEPLRAVAERARRGQMCAHESCILSGQDCGERVYPFRFVVACAPDDGVCVFCEGTGAHKGWLRPAPDCSACAGLGKALSSRDVARELVPSDAGGASLIQSPTRAALDEHGLRAVVERLTR